VLCDCEHKVHYQYIQLNVSLHNMKEYADIQRS
jgi:hypothetical protein